MKEIVIVLGIACLLPVQKATAAVGFPWFHTRPKPVLLEPTPVESTKTESSVVWHGTEMYPRSSGRLYFKDSRDQFKDSRDQFRIKAVKARSSEKIRLSHALAGK